MSAPAISAQLLSKTFYGTPKRQQGFYRQCKAFFSPVRESIPAVSEVSFTIAQGERVALIGPNGAGKSTTIKMLTGILEPTSGTVHVAGVIPTKERSRLSYKIGCVFGQRSQLWNHITAGESYEILRVMYKVTKEDFKKRIDELSEVLRLNTLFDKRPSSMSLGERMKCELVAALLHGPEILFLDEPSIGLDLLAKMALRKLLVEHSKRYGMTILFTSHDMADIEDVCDRVILINYGRVVRDLPTTTLKRRVDAEKRVHVAATSLNVTSLETLDGITVKKVDAEHYEFLVDAKTIALDKAISLIFASGSVSDLSVTGPTLEEIIAQIYREELAA